jgi:acyl-coenzyme A thioesterase PaaI-like protein
MIAELVGFTVGEIGDGRAVGSLRAGPQHANPMGTLHGGVLCDEFRFCDGYGSCEPPQVG